MTNGKLRLGIILTVTGTVALAVHFLVPGEHGNISPDTQFLVGLALVVVGAPFLVAGVRSFR